MLKTKIKDANLNSGEHVSGELKIKYSDNTEFNDRLFMLIV